MTAAPTQLAQLAIDWTGKPPGSGWIMQEKVDGFRAIYKRCPFTGEPGLFTRNGIPIEGTGHILYWLEAIERAAGMPMMIDGEFQVDGTLAATKAWCERGWKAGGEAGRFHAFDCMPLADWRAGGSDMPQLDRLALLERLARAAASDDWTWRPGSRGRDEKQAPIVIEPWKWGFDHYDALAFAREIWLMDGEGIMLKDPSAPYRRNRNGAWQKVKADNGHKWSPLLKAEKERADRLAAKQAARARAKT